MVRYYNIGKLFALAMLLAPTLSSAQEAVSQMTVNVAKPTAQIQSTMYGIFFEDINFGADGGLYAELVKNRSFEFPQPFTGWVPYGNVQVLTENPCFDRNPHYVRITNDGALTRAGLDNEGFKGIGLKKDEAYRLSFYARTTTDTPMKLQVELVDSHHNNKFKQEVEVSGKDWKKVELRIVAPFTDAHSRLRILLNTAGAVDMDHISLFPVNTWKGRENGLRADLAQALYDLHPGIFRFPGGCIVEGTILETRYQWKNSVGPVENRPVNINRWNYTFPQKFFPDYYQSYGMGFFELFQLSEDIGAEPLPVISCGLSCQYERAEEVPLDQLQPYIQDALDLIEFANGPVDSQWGKVRADMGHPAPFNLKFLAVGNEQWGKVYPERLELFMKAIRAKYPEIKIVGTSGPSAEGEQFEYLWPEMKRLKVDLVDEHYYKPPQWFFDNAARYDGYDRKGPKVFAGEYASHDHSSGKANNFLAALSEAAFMTGLERNADVVQLATYAPLFAHVDGWQWNPDLIWFDNLRMMRTPNYYVQQLYGMNAGTDVLQLTMNGAAVTGQNGLYATAALDSRTGEIILKLVNAADKEARVDLTFNGLKKKQLLAGTCTYLQSDDLKAVNTLEGETLVPRMRPVKIEAADQLSLQLPAHYFGVYRLSVGTK